MSKIEIVRIVKQLAIEIDIYFVVFNINGIGCETGHCITLDEVYSTFGITEKEFQEKLLK